MANGKATRSRLVSSVRGALETKTVSAILAFDPARHVVLSDDLPAALAAYDDDIGTWLQRKWPRG